MIDIIGPLYDPPSEPDGDPVRIWGFHVNVTPAVIETNPLLATRIRRPATLRRVWAGDDPTAPTETVPLRFHGEAAAREALGDLWPDGFLLSEGQA